MGKKRILIVAFSDSIHTARWISQLDRSRYDIHLFPSVPYRQIHPELTDINIWQWSRRKADTGNGLLFRNAFPLLGILERIIGSSFAGRISKRFGDVRVIALKKTIGALQPDIVHSMETQNAGYLVSKIRSSFKKKWIHSTWGVDLHYFKEFQQHREKLKKLMTQIDVLVSEGNRDIEIAKSLGFAGKYSIIPSVGGGFDFTLFDSVESEIPPSLRRKIMLKGYEGDERLASKALTALRTVRDRIQEYEVILYSCNRKLNPIIEDIQKKNEFRLIIIGHLDHKALLGIVAESRISITNNLSDGVPNTMLEAMALGAFPIQSDTAITEGWIEDGKNGLLTDPQDTEQIANAISRALQDDVLVNSAAVFNKNRVRSQLNQEIIKRKMEEIYN
jgi:glycosyltransferase involved in cell wall biosynthesis